MSKKNHDKNIGFAGFEAYADEFTVHIPEHDDSAETAPEATSEPEEQTTSTIYEAPEKRTKAGGIWWVIIIVGIGGLWLWGESDNKPRSSSYSSSTSYSTNNSSNYNSSSYSDSNYSQETIPPVGTNNVLNSSQIRYCLSEKIRMDAVETSINTYSQQEIDYFNNAVSDYNSRCGAFKYRRGALSSVENSVNANSSALRAEGLNKLKDWRLKKNTSPSAVLAPQPTAPEPKLVDLTPEEEKQLNIELETGLSLKKVDQNGQAIRGKGGYETGQKFILQYRGRTIAENDTAVYGNLVNHWKIGGADVVQLETASGGNACESEQRLIAVSDGRVILSKDFGNCSPPKISTAPDQVKFTFFVGYGERLVATYKDYKLTQANVKLPTKYDPESNQPGYAYLAKYAKKDDLESILQDDKLNGALSQLMGADFQALKDRMLVYGKATVEDGYLVIAGGMPHSFGIDEGYLAIGLNESVVYSAVLDGEYVEQLKKFVYHVRAYSTESASIPPSSMKKWMGQFEAIPTWKYEK